MTDEQTLTTTLAVLVQRVEDMRGDLADMRAEQASQRTAAVPRTEWEQRNRFVDETFRTIGREIADLRTETRSRRVSWPAVLGAVVAAAALALSVMQLVAR